MLTPILARVADIPRYAHATWPDRRAGLAVEDRDLYAEAQNEEAVASAWFEAVCRMFPHKSIAN